MWFVSRKTLGVGLRLMLMLSSASLVIVVLKKNRSKEVLFKGMNFIKYEIKL